MERRRTALTKSEFTAFVAQYETWVYTVCFQLLRDAHAAQDMTQETFLAAYLHIRACPAGFERQWLGRIAANKCKDHLRCAWKRHVDLPGDQSLPPGLSPPAEEEAVHRLLAQEAREVILQIPEPYGSVLRLCLLQERTVEEAARLLRRPEKTVYTQLRRGKALVQQRLRKEDAHGTAPSDG